MLAQKPQKVNDFLQKKQNFRIRTKIILKNGKKERKKQKDFEGEMFLEGIFEGAFWFSCLKNEKNSQLPIDKARGKWYYIYMYRL